MKRFAWEVIILLIIILGGWSIASRGREASPATSEPIKIGALLCLTGPCASWGENSLKGIQLAIDEINKDGGVLGRPFEVVVQDSQEETVIKAVSGYQQLLRGNIKYIIGPNLSPAGLAIAPIAAKDSIIITSPSLGVKEFNETADNIFNLWPHDEIATRKLARFAVENKRTKVALFSSKQAWESTQAKIFEDELIKLGGTITIKVEPLETVRDLRTEAAKIKSSNPDVVMFTSLTQLGIAAKELKQIGYSGPKLSILMDQSRLETADGGLEGTIYAQYPESSKSFLEAFEDKYKMKPDTTADVAYDVVYFYRKGIEVAGIDSVLEVKNALGKMTSFAGASGSFVFDGMGGIDKNPSLWVVKDGQFTAYKE